jgi:hypothetical protein
VNRLIGETCRVNTGQPSFRDLRAVLFDSGGVLVEPAAGRWNPRVDSEQTRKPDPRKYHPVLKPAV